MHGHPGHREVTHHAPTRENITHLNSRPESTPNHNHEQREGLGEKYRMNPMLSREEEVARWAEHQAQQQQRHLQGEKDRQAVHQQVRAISTFHLSPQAYAPSRRYMAKSDEITFSDLKY